MNNEANSNDSEPSEVADEYKIWKKNLPFLYDTMLSHALLWPSLTIQWLPPTPIPRIVFGTNTSNSEQNYLIVSEVILPDPSHAHKPTDDCKGVTGLGASPSTKLNTIAKIAHEGEINKARYFPQNPDIIATKVINGEVHLFDISKQKFIARLVGHKKEGFGLSWNETKSGILASSGEDQLICIWDIASKKDADRYEPIITLNGHQSIVGDVCFHKKQPDILGSVDDNKRVMLWDLRTGNKPISNVQGHSGEIYCIDFNPIEENLFATGAADKAVMLWDFRKMDTHLTALEYHMDDVNCVQWNPKDVNILASGSNDHKVCVWDISQIGVELSKEDYDDGPAELLFVHGGHVAGVCDVSWRKDAEMMMASTSDENIVQVWQMASEIYHDENKSPSQIADNFVE